MPRVIKIILTILILLLILGIVFYPRLKNYFVPKDEKGGKDGPSMAGSGSGKGDGKGGGKAIVDVWVVQAKRLDEVIKSTGTILANEEVDIRSEISGRIVKLSLKEGDYVKKGTTLLKTFDDDLQAQLKKLEYSKKLAEENEYRQKKLLEKEAISQREYDISLTSVNTIQADIENIKAQLSKTVIQAPFDGTIGLRYVSEGSYLTSSTRIATLTNVNPAKLDFSIPAKYASIVRKGSRILFTIEDGEHKFEGTVYAIDPKIDPQTRTLQLRAVSPNPSQVLIPGAFAKIELVMNSKGSAISVPTEALIPELSGHKVFIVKNGKAVSRPVTVGLRGEREVEISGGLQVGDTLITSGILLVKPEGDVEIKQVVTLKQ